MAFLAGCESTPGLPHNLSDTDRLFAGDVSLWRPQNLNVSATHDSAVQPGVPMYYQVTSPVNVTVYVFDKNGPSARRGAPEPDAGHEP